MEQFPFAVQFRGFGDLIPDSETQSLYFLVEPSEMVEDILAQRVTRDIEPIAFLLMHGVQLIQAPYHFA